MERFEFDPCKIWMSDCGRGPIADITTFTSPSGAAVDEISLKPSSITCEAIDDKIKDAIKEYDKERIFTDEILADLLADKINEKCKEEVEKEKARIISLKKARIDDFITSIKRVIFSGNRTIVIWADGTKTTITCGKDDVFDREKAVALCIVKHMFGDISYYNEIFKSLDLEDKTKTVTIPDAENPKKKNKRASSFLNFLFRGI